MSGKTIMLAVQGEGRGHMTQALSLFHLLSSEGFDICCVIVGGNPDRHQADFLRKILPVPVVQVYSPYFVRRGDRGISMPATIARLCWSLPRLFRSLRIFDKLVKYHQPSMIIQCYEPLVALYRLFHPFPGKIVSIGHQYIYLHESFQFPEGHVGSTWLLRTYTRFTSFGSDLVLAISWYDMASSRHTKLVVVPPILRNEVLEMNSSDQGYMLVYLVNAGYLEDIRSWSALHPEVTIHCFTDVSQLNPAVLQQDDDHSFFIHGLDANIFLEYLAGCSVLVSTAGFETVCEALFFGKHCFVVPVEGHFEQYCNARDALVLGVASGVHFDLDRAYSLSTQKQDSDTGFRRWVGDCPDILLHRLRPYLPVVRDQLSGALQQPNVRMHAIPGGLQCVIEQIQLPPGGVRVSGS
jgi:uncharacterized protein (TIGR00661 family)